MAFPPSFIDELVARNPIEDVVGQYVSLKRSGGNLFGLCPFHGEKTASFSVSPDKGIYYCFGCHKGGGVINFQMEIEGLSYPDAIRSLAKRVGMQVPEDEQYQSRYKAQERLWALSKEAARFFYSKLYAPEGAAALAYARGRGMPKSTLTTFGIGYAPNTWDSLVKAMKAKGYTEQELIDSGLVTKSQKNGNIYDRFRDRLMFPIIDVRGNIIGFGGRIMNNDDPNAAKYLNSPETMIFNKRKNLFALNLAKKSKLGYLILVEGYMDAIALHQYGFDCAVASLGTALTEDHAALLTRYTDQVVLIYDGDKAGQNATQRAIPILEKAGLQVKVLRMKDAKDPDEFLKKFGADRFKLLLEDASNRVEYQLNAIRRQYDIREDDQRIKFVREAAELISKLGNEVSREVYGRRIAEEAKITFEAMQLEVEKTRTKLHNKEKKKADSEAVQPVRKRQQQYRKLNFSVDGVKVPTSEECLMAMILKDPSILSMPDFIKEDEFSVPLYAKIFRQIKERFNLGLNVSAATLENLSNEEYSHIVAVVSSDENPVTEQAVTDCLSTIRQNNIRAKVNQDSQLKEIQERLLRTKGSGK